MSNRSNVIHSAHFVILLTILFIRLFPIFFYIAHGGNLPDIIYKDHYIYLWGATSILKTGCNPFDFFPPLNSLFIAGILWLAGGSVIAASMAMAIIGWLTVVVVYSIAQKIFDQKVAVCTAILCGLYPNFIMYGVTFCSENLGKFWVCLMFFLFVYYRLTNRLIFLIGVGITMGIAAQTRGGLHYFIPFFIAGLFLLRYKKQKAYFIKESFVVIISLLLSIYGIGWITGPIHRGDTINPRSGIGSVVHGANRITTSCADYGDIRGNIFYFINDVKEPWPEKSQFYSDELMACSTSQILIKTGAFILEQPILYIKNSFYKLSCFWSPNQLVIATIKLKLQPNNIAANVISLIIAFLYLVLIVSALFGLAMSNDPLKPFFILFIVFYCILIFFTVGNSKLRLPLMPLLIMYSSFFIITTLQKRKEFFKKAVTHRLTMLLALLMLINSALRCIELLPEPSEIYVRQVELCNRLGFPKTASYLIKQYQNLPYLSENQKKRLQLEYNRAQYMQK